MAVNRPANRHWSNLRAPRDRKTVGDATCPDPRRLHRATQRPAGGTYNLHPRLSLVQGAYPGRPLCWNLVIKASGQFARLSTRRVSYPRGVRPYY